MKTQAKKSSPDARTASSPKPLELAVTTIDAFPLSQLFHDYENARNGGKELTIDDIPPAVVESIQTKGIINPLNIRLISKSEREEHKIPAQYTHISWAGNSRRCVGMHLGLLTVPVRDYGQIDRTLAAELADLDNCQRTDLTTSERIRNHERLCKKHGWTYWNEADPTKSLGHRLALGGKSQSYAWARLASLPVLATQALDSGQLTISVATKLAGIFDKDSQKRAIEIAIRDNWTDERAAEIIREHYTAELKGVSFDTKDATLPGPDGKPISCEQCPFRSGNQAGFVGGRGDICGKPSCLKAKISAQFKLDAAAHKKAGGTVWTPNQAKAAGLGQYGYDSLSTRDYLPIDTPIQSHNFDGYDFAKQTVTEVLKGESYTAEVILAESPATGKTYRIIPTATVRRLLAKKGLLKKEKPETNSWDKQDKERRAKVATARAIIAKIQTAAIAAVTPAQAKLAASKPFRLAVRTLADRLSDDQARAIAKLHNMEPKTLQLKEAVNHREMVPKFAETCGDLDLLQLWVSILTHAGCGYDGTLNLTCWDDTAHTVFEWLGIDLKTELANARKPAPIPTTYFMCSLGVYSAKQLIAGTQKGVFVVKPLDIIERTEMAQSPSVAWITVVEAINEQAAEDMALKDWHAGRGELTAGGRMKSIQQPKAKKGDK